MAKARKSAYSHLMDFFHEHPHGRVYEVLFWGGMGAGALVFAWIAVARGWMSEPLGWLLGIVGACFIAFALLPHPRKRRRPGEHAIPLKGKRAQIAEQVKASKAEKKKKGPPPPGPPIRRG